jgi:glucan 1,3-beta-glucosidase
MHSFERGWGWFYWTWKTESAAQWSYKKGLEIGMLPEKAYERAYNCEGEMPDFEGLPENL